MLKICSRENNNCIIIFSYSLLSLCFYAIIVLVREYEIKRKTQIHVWKYKHQVIPSLASKANSCVDDELVFLTMSIIGVIRMLSIYENTVAMITTELGRSNLRITDTCHCCYVIGTSYKKNSCLNYSLDHENITYQHTRWLL